MEYLKKELILNLTVISAAIAAILGAIGAELSISSSEFSNRDDWGPVSFDAS
ncbi:hypothetical protein [Paenibacillus sp. 7541]|uniref:hypothetical protein n=1 Tax=Paenibacillus TaxID=44249 RepID=UPI001595A743|nr:hypothetical protein [Paenibacillus sp. 7541]